MKLHIFNDHSSLYAQATNHVVTDLLQKPSLVLGLAAGNTPTNLYKNLIEFYQRNKISFSQVKTFNLDEFLGISPDNTASFFNYMQESFLRHIDVKAMNTYALLGTSENIEQTCLAYENTIRQLGGIDLQILGVGSNGHLAFNEPGSDPTSITRLVTLADESRKANQSRFAGDVPKQALTMGLGTILSAKKIILLATGESKRKAIWHLMNGQATKDWPCSWLQSHTNLHVFLDDAAAMDVQLLA
jgi:glucosamine-6-phosphate deaminase